MTLQEDILKSIQTIFDIADFLEEGELISEDDYTKIIVSMEKVQNVLKNNNIE